MLKIVQKFADKMTNFLFGGYMSRQADSYEMLLKAMQNRPPEPAPEPEEVRTIPPRQVRQMKRELFSKSLQGGIASLYLDPRVEGVKVPERFRGSPTLVLNYSYKYHIADFDFDDEKVVASLAFGGVPFQCIVPWDAVMGIGNQSESCYYSFVEQPPDFADGKQPIQAVGKVEDKIFDEQSHQQALERRSQFKVIKGGKE